MDNFVLTSLGRVTKPPMEDKVGQDRTVNYDRSCGIKCRDTEHR